MLVTGIADGRHQVPASHDMGMANATHVQCLHSTTGTSSWSREVQEHAYSVWMRLLLGLSVHPEFACLTAGLVLVKLGIPDSWREAPPGPWNQRRCAILCVGGEAVGPGDGLVGQPTHGFHGASNGSGVAPLSAAPQESVKDFH